MNRLVTSFKIASVLALLAASFIGYCYFSVWQENARPSVSDISWESESIILGQPVVLRATVRTPWHRRITSIMPNRVPGSIVAAKNGGRLRRGNLDLSGHRTWHLDIPLVPCTPEPVGGQPVELPLSPTRRISPNALSIPLPPLAVVVPEDVPDAPVASTAPLRPGAPAIEVATATEATEAPFSTALACGLAALIIVTALVVRHLLRPKPAPPVWETARQALDALEMNPPPDPAPYFLRLTDILKHYATGRFGMPAEAASATELLASIVDLPNLGNAPGTSLASVVRQADSAKFAAASIGLDARREALVRVRQFVEETIPNQEENAHA